MKHAATLANAKHLHKVSHRIITTAAYLPITECPAVRRDKRLLLFARQPLAAAVALPVSSVLVSIATLTTTTAAASPLDAVSSSSAPLDRAALSASPASAMPHNTPPYSLPASALRSASHTFTGREMDVYRLYALLATSAASNQLAFLAHLATYIPFGYEHEAAESHLARPGLRRHTQDHRGHDRGESGVGQARGLAG